MVTETYEAAVVAECGAGHREANLAAQFRVIGAICGVCGLPLTVIHTGRVRVRNLPTLQAPSRQRRRPEPRPTQDVDWAAWREDMKRRNRRPGIGP